MLNIGRIRPGGAEYYVGEIALSAEAYYLGRGEAPGRWVGSLAEEMGLRGEVDPDHFRARLEGKHPFSAEQLVASPRAKAPTVSQAPEGEWLSVKEAAAQLGVSTRFVRRILATGVLEGEKARSETTGRVGWRVQRAQVNTYAVSHKPSKRRPGSATMAEAIAAVETKQPGSKVYRAMTAVAYYGGLRPSEVAMLRVKSLTLPTKGWGRIDVTEADISWDEPGEPKTGPRRVPIPPVLVDALRQWIEHNGLGCPDALLFRTRNGTRPSTSNWGRAWHRALESIDQPPLRVYDCRHAAATTWLRAGVPLGETARRLGDSVETLVSTFVGALEGDEELGNKRIEAELAASQPICP